MHHDCKDGKALCFDERHSVKEAVVSRPDSIFDTGVGRLDCCCKRVCCDKMLVCRDRGFLFGARLLDCRYVPNCPSRRGFCC